MENDLAARTLDRAAIALQTARIACLPEIVKLLNTLSGNTDEVSVAELAEVIQHDQIILSKVVAAANTYYYNPNAVAVTNVVQAIHVIGFERIRSLAMSLMMAEQASRGQTVDEQRAIAAQALVAGCIAQSIARSRPLLDRDRAFVCTCLRSFGHVVMASCMADDYKQVRTQVAHGTADEAYRRIFGLTPLELGYHLLHAANLPAEILSTLRALPAHAAAALEPRPDDQMVALADCADRLAELTCNTRLTSEEFATRSLTLTRRYEGALPALSEELHPLMQNATDHFDHIVRTFRLRSLPSRTISQMRACRNAVAPECLAAAQASAAAPTEPPSAGAIAVPSGRAARAVEAAIPSSVRTHSPSPSPDSAVSAGAPTLAALQLPDYDWQQGIKQIATRLSAPDMTAAKLRQALVEAVCTGLGGKEALLFSHLPRHSGFHLTEGCGRIHGRLKTRSAATLHRGERTIFGVCLERNENVNIHHAHDPKIHPYLPAWVRGESELGAFVLFPLSDGAVVQGALLVGWPEACHITLSHYQVHAIRTTIAFVCKAQVRVPAGRGPRA